MRVLLDKMNKCNDESLLMRVKQRWRGPFFCHSDIRWPSYNRFFYVFSHLESFVQCHVRPGIFCKISWLRYNLQHRCNQLNYNRLQRNVSGTDGA